MKVSDLPNPSRLTRIGYLLLRIDRLRHLICRGRWYLLKNKLQRLPAMDEAVGEATLSHNMGAFEQAGVFGMARRMSLLLFPTAAIFKDRLHQARILIVGPRTEDDIFWAKSLGLFQTEGLDLFTYSPSIKLGDIHSTDFPDQSYDAVLLGWMLSYSRNPRGVVDECLRILKPGGLLGIGIESNVRQKIDGVKLPRVNALNSPDDLQELVRLPIVFNNNSYQDVTYDCCVVFRNVPSVVPNHTSQTSGPNLPTPNSPLPNACS